MEVTAIYLYPIKGLAPVSLDAAKLKPKGLEHDRRWMLTDHRGVFLSQRSHPRLALLQPKLQDDHLLIQSKTSPERTLAIPFSTTGEPQMVTIWEDQCPAGNVGKQYDEWFSAFLGEPCRLVKMEETTHRPVDPQYASSSDTVSFADGFPYLIANQASLDDLNRRLAQPVPMGRFRPNIVLKGAPAWSEDQWTSLRIGNQRFRSLKPCARCEVVTIDQHTGQRGAEPLKTLSTFRQKGHQILFGVNACWDGKGNAEIRVGESGEAFDDAITNRYP